MTYNYTIGIYLTKEEAEKINPKYLSKLNNKDVLVLSKTFNTDINAEKGDILKVNVEEVWRHRKDGIIRYSLHKPKVMEKIEAATTSSLADLDAMVVSRGVEVVESELKSDEEGGGEKGEEFTDFPKRMQESFKNVIGKWKPWVMQWHLRGEKSLHTDFRLKVNDHLEGFTLFSPPSIDKPDMIKGEVKNIRGTIKNPQPVSWLKVDTSDYFEKGGIGATKEHPAFFAIVAKGKYTIHDVGDHRILIQLKSDKGRVNKVKLKDAPEYVQAFNNKLPDRLKQLDGLYSVHIAHIDDKHIMLFDKIKDGRGG